MNEKVRIYVCSCKISSLDYVDTESMGHPCVTSQHADTLYTEYKYFPGTSGLIPDEQKKAINMVIEFCKRKNIEYEIVDIAGLNFMGKTRLALKGIKAPTIVFKDKKIEGVPSRENLKTLLV